MEQPGKRRRADDASEPVVGGVEPFELFYRREYDRAVRLAYVLSGSRWGSEDLAQEAFMEAHRRWEEIGSYRDPSAWVRRVISNRSVSWYRRRRAELRALTKVVGRDRQLLEELEPASEEVWQAVRRLPDRQAQVVALAYLEDMSLEQISELLGISVPTVGTHLQRARKTLQTSLQTNEEVN